MFMALLDVTIVNIAMPAIITDLHTTVTHASWVLNAYSLVLAVFFLSMGRVADRYGQKRVFIFGLVTFTIFSLLCGFAPNIDWLIAFRAGQGLGGAALLTISLAIVLGAFPRRQQGMAVGIWGALGTAAAAVGPVLGGVLVTYGHWSWIFFVNVPDRHRRRRRLRASSSRRGAQGEGRGRHRHPRHAHLRRRPLLPHAGARARATPGAGPRPAIVALFVVAVADASRCSCGGRPRTTSPMFPVNLLRIRSFTAANTAIMFIGLAMGGTFLMVVLFLVSVLGYSELRAAHRR